MLLDDDPEEMTPDARLGEIACILAAGCLRLRRYDSVPFTEKPLDCPAAPMPSCVSGLPGESRPQWRCRHDAQGRKAGESAPRHDRRRAAGEVRRGVRRAHSVPARGLPSQADHVAAAGERGRRPVRPSPQPRRKAGQGLRRSPDRPEAHGDPSNRPVR